MSLAQVIQLLLESLLLSFLLGHLGFLFFLNQKDLLGLEVGETNWKLDIVLDGLSFIFTIEEGLRSEVVVIDFLKGKVRWVKLVKAIFVEWALDLDQLICLGEAGVLRDDDVRICHLVWRIVLIFEHLPKLNTCIKSFDVQTVLDEFVLKDTAVHLLDVFQGVRRFYIVVLGDSFHSGAGDRVMVLQGAQFLHYELLLFDHVV